MNLHAYKTAWFFVIVVLLTGLFFPHLFGSDAPEYASIATQMHFKNDWINIINHHHHTGLPYDYLDKPHMLFWSAMAGYKLFGVHDWSYRLISVLMSVAGAYATFRVGKLLYNANVGKLAALFYITAQAIILANHDVKTDTLLTNFVVLAVWQLVTFVQQEKIQNVIWASLFLALGVGTKGMIAVLVAGCLIFFYIVGLKKWKLFFNYKWLIGVIAFFIALSPFLYFYYLQFDLHPEKVVNGGTGRSGIKFLLWGQSFERFAGDRNMLLNPQFNFFFHSFLWAFLPWSFLAYFGSFNRIGELFKTKFSSFFTREQLTFTGTWAMFIIMSFSKFKLPHYINILFPYFAVFTAAHLFQLLEKRREKTLHTYAIVQYVIIAFAFILLMVINFWAFPVTAWWVIAIGALWFLFIIFIFFREKHPAFTRIWYYSSLTILLFNFFMNVNFYPALSNYDGGYKTAQFLKTSNLKKEDIYLYQLLLRTYDFHTQTWQPVLDSQLLKEKLNQKSEIILFTNKKNKVDLEKMYQVDEMMATPSFAISLLKLNFLNPATRGEKLDSVYLLKVRR